VKSLPPVVRGRPDEFLRGLLGIYDLISISVEFEVIPEPCMRITVRPRMGFSPPPFPMPWWKA